MRLIKIIGVFYLVIFLMGCKKDPYISHLPHNYSDCVDLPEQKGNGFFNMATGPVYLNVSQSQYHPFTPNILYYFTEDTAGGTYFLWYLNRLTNKKKFLTENVLTSVNISQKGWLTFCKFDYNIYIIKENGDSLKQLTNNGKCLYPTWDGNDYIYYSEANNGAVYKINLRGELVDTLQIHAIPISVHSELLGYRSSNGSYIYLYVLNTVTNVVKLIASKKQNSSRDGIFDLFFDRENKYIYYSNGYGLYKVNLDDLSTKMVVKSCPTEKYMFWNICYLTNKLTATQILTDYIEPNTLFSTYNIVEFNEDGTNMQKITIP